MFLSYKNNRYSGRNDKNGSLGRGGKLVNFDKIFWLASLHAWKDIEHKRYSPHDMRDFLESILEGVEVNPMLIKPLLSHKPTGIEASYSEHDDSEYLAVFKKALPDLVPRTTGELQREIDEKTAENQQNKAQIESQNKTMEDMKAEHKKDMEEMKKEFDERFDKFMQVIDGGKFTLLPKDNKHKWMVTRDKPAKSLEDRLKELQEKDKQ